MASISTVACTTWEQLLTARESPWCSCRFAVRSVTASCPQSVDSPRAIRSRESSSQALVLTPAGAIVYSGRIDNRYPSVGRKRDVVTEHEFEDALAHVVAGRNVAVPSTQPVGCLMEDAATATDGEVTFNRDIAPLMFSSCTECHRPGEAAPFSLLTFADACDHANQMAAVMQQGSMPPWHPTAGFGHFRHERRLKAEEIALVKRWIASGKPEGDPQDRLASPPFTTGWRLGKPDLILKMSEAFSIPADGSDVHQHFVLPTGLRKDRLVSAIEFRPGNSRVTHHASFYVDNRGAARQLDERDSGVGYGSYSGPGFDNYGSFRSWLPGMTPQRLPRGMGCPLPAHSDIVLEIHYQPTGKPETDQSSIGVFFAESSAKQLVMELQVMNKSLQIPAGASRHWHRASFTLPAAATLLDAAPHMHRLGKEMKAVARLPDGREQPLIWIKDWDFNWQGQYIYVDSIRLPRGTVIEVDSWFDNSAANPLNPHSPPRQVSWGEQTRDEMAVCHFRYACDSISELQAVNNGYRTYLADQQQKYRQVSHNSRSVAP
ncbi:MAG: hypothetical protein B7Z55_08040 [Planctomycetales bacterium 12-60-4]|nr:MAG: hypothetical protein B7Z55_08040 [Planctomycetales bacterium 12-60-4]